MRNILIVDDVSINRKIIRKILEKNIDDIVFFEAEDGIEALEFIKNDNISVIILDIIMPRKDGLEVLKEIKKDELYKSIPVIMLSTMDEINTVKEALSLGALDYFTKPLTQEQLKITLTLKVKNALELYEKEKEIKKLYNQIKSDLMVAQQLQRSMVVTDAVYENVIIKGKYIPCQEIGGDIFCSKKVNNRVFFLMADASGHGISAAMISSMISSIFYAKIDSCELPSDLLTNINKSLVDVFNGSNLDCVSAFAGCIENNKLLYSNAGHPYPVFFDKANRKIECLELDGFLLGFLESSIYETKEVEINKDDMLILYTDGLFDKGVNDGYSHWHFVLEYCKNSISFEGIDLSNALEELVFFFKNKDDLDFIDDVEVMFVKKIN